MHWEGPDEPQAAPTSESVADLRFRMRCPALPVDHAADLCAALQTLLPWLADEPQAGIHALHGAESGNGWMRPDDPRALLPLSRRTRLALRLPRARIEDAAELMGHTLRLGAHRLSITIHPARVHTLRGWPTMFARYVAFGQDAAEEDEEFLRRCAARLEALGIAAPRLMSGRAHPVAAPEGTLHCRSLMIDGLAAADSVRLQEQGLGLGRLLGCGLFLPHKSIAPVAGGDAR